MADTYAYDAYGRLNVARNDAATQIFGYDALDRVVTVWDPGIGTARRVYDADGRTVQLVSPDGEELGFADGVVTTYQYDGRGRIVGIADPVAGSWSFGYDAAGRLRHRAGPGGVSRTVEYTDEGFVDEVTLEGPSGPIDVFDYQGHDALGSPATLTTSEGVTSFGYDAMNRLTSTTYPNLESESFVYDRLGNRVQHTGRDGVLRKYVVDAADQLQQILDAQDQELERFTNDAAGRRTGHRVGGSLEKSYDYDALSRLRRVTQPGSGVVTALSYDAQDARYRRDETGSPVSLFFGEWMEYRGGEVVRLVHGGGLDNVLAEVAQADVRQLLTDASNNVTHVASAAPSVYERRYEAFGIVRSSRDPVAVERGFAGRPREGSTGLLYLRARHYDPATGRFLQADPLGIETDQLYAYAASNPIVFGDPLGLAPRKLQDRAPKTQLGDPADHLGCPELSCLDALRPPPEGFTQGPVVVLVLRPVSVLPTFYHAALFVAEAGTPQTSRIVAQYSLGFFDRTFNQDQETIRLDEAAFRNPGGRNLFFPIGPHPGVSPRQTAESILREAEEVQLLLYNPGGPNSNTAAVRPLLLSGHGDAVPHVPNAPGLMLEIEPPAPFTRSQDTP